MTLCAAPVGIYPRFTLQDGLAVTVPAGRYLGAITGLQVAPDGHIWLLHVASNMSMGSSAPGGDVSARLPAVCEFDANGVFVQGWGGPDWLPRQSGVQQWPMQEETIALDDAGTLWIFGADTTHDHAVQRFSRDGMLLLRIGCFGEEGNDDTPDRLGCPTDAYHDVARREVYITDGYVNHRVAVFNSDTGAFLRAWGAYGQAPNAATVGTRQSFNNPVHAISLGPDGLLYVCDRKNDRVQVFDAIGLQQARFVREIALDRPSPFGTTFNLTFTPNGRFMIVNDGNHSRLWVVDLASWEFVDSFIVPGAQEEDLYGTIHKVIADARGDLLLARTAVGILRMRYEGGTKEETA